MAGAAYIGDSAPVLEGIKAAADIIGSTLGPYGQNVSIDVGDGVFVLKDGVQVSRLLQFSDRWERMGAKLVMDGCMATVRVAGDGTTGTAVMIPAIIELCKSKTFELGRGLNAAAADAIAHIESMKIPIIKDGAIDPHMMRSVATISANNDKFLGETIADAFIELGPHAQVFMEMHDGKTEREILSGYAYEGHTHGAQFMYNLPDRLDVSNALVALINQEVKDMLELKPVIARYRAIKPEMVDGSPVFQPLVIVVSEPSYTIVSSLINDLNEIRQGKPEGPIYLVSCPGNGEDRHEMLRDISIMTGAKSINHRRGAPLADFGFSVSEKTKTPTFDFGRASRVSVHGGRVTVFSNDDRADVIKAHVEELKTLEDNEFNRKRISKLSGGIGVIRVGGETKTERDNNRELVDDAVRACYAALDGVVPGGGRCLETAASQMKAVGSEEFVEGYEAVRAAMLAPKKRLWVNAGKEAPKEGGDPWMGLTVPGDSLNFLESGIIDPSNVVKAIVRNSVAQAFQFLTTGYHLSFYKNGTTE